MIKKYKWYKEDSQSFFNDGGIEKKMPINLDDYGITESEDGEFVSKGNLLKAEMVGKPGTTTEGKILNVSEKEFGDEKRVIITLDIPEFELKGIDMVLNKTNLKAMLNAFGSDDHEWLSETVDIHVERVDFNGKQVPALRLYPVGK